MRDLRESEDSSRCWQRAAGVISYIAKYPILRTAQIAVHFTPWQTCPIKHRLNFSGKHPANQCAKTVRTQISTIEYSQILIYTPE